MLLDGQSSWGHQRLVALTSDQLPFRSKSSSSRRRHRQCRLAKRWALVKAQVHSPITTKLTAVDKGRSNCNTSGRCNRHTFERNEPESATPWCQVGQGKVRKDDLPLVSSELFPFRDEKAIPNMKLLDSRRIHVLRWHNRYYAVATRAARRKGQWVQTIATPVGKGRCRGQVW
jgi:hypothetical protein